MAAMSAISNAGTREREVRMKENTSGKGKKQTLLGSVLAVAVLIIVSLVRLPETGSDAPGTENAMEADSAETGGSVLESSAVSEALTEEAEMPEAAPESTLESVMGDAQSVGWAEAEPEDEPQALYSFRNERLLNQHYEKHGMEMGFATVEDYVEAANAVINHPDVLHKLEAEDNDDIYFLEDTSEFVVVSTDGFIRTYFIASGGIDYYNRQ